jgi:hypothetical protein
VPALYRDALVRRTDGIEQFVEAFQSVRRQVDSLGDGVEIPSQDALGCGPTSVALQHLLD